MHTGITIEQLIATVAYVDAKVQAEAKPAERNTAELPLPFVLRYASAVPLHAAAKPLVRPGVA